MRIVALDGYTLNPGDNPWDPIARLGELVVHDHTPEDRIPSVAADFEIVIANKAPLNAATIAALPKLKFITVVATGYNIIDIEAAGARGIPVCNVPEYGTDSVAQFTFAMLLELCHHTALHAQAVRDGEWTKCRDFSFWKTPLVELAGKTIGIIGFGRIGQKVAELAQAFGMKVLAHRRTEKPVSFAGKVEFVSLERLFAESDVVSLHCPLTPQTRGIVSANLLSKMKKSAFLINTSRGPLVNEQDLADALNHGSIAGAAVDVVSEEPIRANNPLLKAKNIFITPHIAWAALEPRQRVMQTTAKNISAFLAGSPIHVVNQEQLKKRSATA